jgi:type 1 glutamine amidotransferase
MIVCRHSLAQLRMVSFAPNMPGFQGHARMSKLRSSLIGAALGVTLSILIPAEALAQKKAPDGVKVLLLSGGARQHHGYRDQAIVLARGLEDTGRYEVTICEDGSILTSPGMSKYDVLIVHVDRRDPEFKFTEPQQKALLEFVHSGKGYVSIHGADNAAPDWLPEWREMLGGVFSHVGLPDSKTKKGEFQVKIANRDHPVTKDLNDFTLKDELYYHLQMKRPIEPLAVVEADGQTWPVAWVLDYGKGRVFHTVFGHRDFGPDKNEPLTNEAFMKLVLQGTDYVADPHRKTKP